MRVGAPDSAAISAPITARICDAVCIAFALWALCCHAVVALGGSLIHLLVVYALASGTIVTAIMVIRRHRARTTELSPRLPRPQL